ncbi:MAG: MBL fold metallo-hydrolase [Pseudomonadota bacterium]|nr:MBL fold metallo-hydrolase [Pseudomonadota bacterium]
MADRLRLTILGCSSSPGVPRIHGDWGACDPNNPKNRRTRTAALIERISARGRTVVAIDCGPDFRQQMLAAKVKRLDAIMLTHAHADHIHGIDDMRSFAQSQGAQIPVYAETETFGRVFEAFAYVFRTPKGSDYPPIARHIEIEAGQRFAIDGPGGPIDVLPMLQIHGAIHSLGFHFGPIAYCTDVSAFPAETVETLRGIDHIVLGALQYRRHPSHFSLQQALDWIDELGVGSATLTHMHTPLDYDTVRRETPAHVEPGYDGLVIERPL